MKGRIKMKKIRNLFNGNFHYLCIVSVIAFGLITIIGSGGGGGGGGGGDDSGGTGNSGTADSNFRAYVSGYVPNIAGAGGIAVINCDSNTVETFIDTVGKYFDVAAVPSGKYVYATDYDAGEVLKIDTSNNNVLSRSSTKAGAYGIDFTPDGGYAFVACTNSTPTVTRISVSDDIVKEITLTSEDGFNLGSPRDVAVTTDGNAAYLSTGSYRNTIGYIGLVSPLSSENPTVSAIHVGGSPNNELAITPDGNYLYIASGYPYSSVIKVNVADNTVITEIDVPYNTSIHGVAVSPDGSWVYVSSRTNGVVIIDTETDEVVNVVEAGFDPVGIAFTPDGKHAYVASGDVYIIDVEKQEVVGEPVEIYYGPLDVYIRAFGIAIVE